MRKKDAVRRMRARSVQVLLKESGWSLDSELTAQISANIYTRAIYKSSDGRVLQILEDGAGNVYESIEAWLSLLQSLRSIQNQPPIHLLHGRLPQERDFINQVPELINELAVKLDIPLQQLDKSEKSLEAVDWAVRRKGQYKCLEAEIFAPLVAYVGEVIKQEINGRWEMRTAEDLREIVMQKIDDRWKEVRLGENPEVGEPWIVDEQGRNYSAFIIVYDELYESPKCCIYGAIGGQIRSHLLF